MLFDLRSRRRRTGVRIIFVFLAVVLVGGLLLVGVGTGSGNGGLLNALGSSNNGGSNSGQSQLVDKELKKAEAAVKANPNSAAAWASLFLARREVATTGSDITAAGDITKSGLKVLAGAAVAWQRYVKLTNGKPSEINSEAAAQIYQVLTNYPDEASSWEYAIQAAPKAEKADLDKPYICLALSNYAAGSSSQGALAEKQAIKLTPELQRLTIKADFTKAKKSKTDAKELVAENCG